MKNINLEISRLIESYYGNREVVVMIEKVLNLDLTKPIEKPNLIFLAGTHIERLQHFCADMRQNSNSTIVYNEYQTLIIHLENLKLDILKFLK